MGDPLVAVDDHLVIDSDHAMALFAASARAVRLVLWRHTPPGDTTAAPLVGQARASAEGERPTVVPGGKQAWAYYTQDARKLTHLAAPIYEDITATVARRMQ